MKHRPPNPGRTTMRMRLVDGTPKPSTDWSLRGDPVARFRTKYRIADSGCWEWTGGKTSRGYGIFSDRSRIYIRAHRFAYEAFVGPIPPRTLVCHHCDNPGCVNPEHLFLGSPKANTQDMIRKGRRVSVSRTGELHQDCKLTDHQIDEIRALGGTMTRASIGRLYGVSATHISGILRGKKRIRPTGKHRTGQALP